jgi:hypothetical protein
MSDPQRYDSDLEMFCDAPRPLDHAHLCFLRWLAEQGRLEHAPAGPPSGELAAVTCGRPVLTASDSALPDQAGPATRGEPDVHRPAPRGGRR